MAEPAVAVRLPGDLYMQASKYARKMEITIGEGLRQYIEEVREEAYEKGVKAGRKQAKPKTRTKTVTKTVVKPINQFKAGRCKQCGGQIPWDLDDPAHRKLLEEVIRDGHVVCEGCAGRG